MLWENNFPLIFTIFAFLSDFKFPALTNGVVTMATRRAFFNFSVFQINFSGRRKQKEESEETAPDVDEIAASTPSTSRDENQLSDSDSKETVGSFRIYPNIC